MLAHECNKAKYTADCIETNLFPDHD